MAKTALHQCSAFALAALLVCPVNATDDLTRPIRVSADAHFLIQSDGQPFFWLADTAWELFYRLDRGESDQYLKDRSSKGFNVIQAVATGKIGLSGPTSPNRDGETPFVDGDLSQPNPRYFAHIDWVVARAAHYGLRIAILPTWGSSIEAGPEQGFDSENAEAYGRWIGHRYRGRGIIWILGGDTNPLAYGYAKFAKDAHDQWRGVGDKVVVDYRSVYDAMARGIQAGEGGDPLITYHPAAGSPSGTALPRMSLYFGDREWFDVSLLQSSHQKIGSANLDGGAYLRGGPLSGYFLWNAVYSYVPIAAEYFSTPARPVIDGEPRYEDHPMYTSADVFVKPNYKAQHYWRSDDVRTALYHSLFAGAAGHTYGHFSIWDFYDPTGGTHEEFFRKYSRLTWQRALGAPGAAQMQHGKALMLSRPYFSRIPDQSLIVGDAGEAGLHMSATRDRSGAYAMIYLPQGQRVQVDLSRLGRSQFRAWWFDPRTGAAIRATEPSPGVNPQIWTPPTSGAGNDWILVLDDVRGHFPPPGTQVFLNTPEVLP